MIGKQVLRKKQIEGDAVRIALNDCKDYRLDLNQPISFIVLRRWQLAHRT